MIEANTTNPIALRSREMTIDSFCDLMRRMPFRDISMQRIAENAGLGRRTLYRHFASKEDILNAYLDRMGEEYLNSLTEADYLARDLTAKVYFAFFQRHLDFLKLMYRDGLMLKLLEKFDQMLDTIVNTLRSQHLSNPMPKFIRYYRAFYSGCYWKLMCQWLEDGAREAPEEMAEIFRQIIVYAAEHVQ